MLGLGLRKTPLLIYRSSNGKESVRDWLKALDVADRQAVGQDLMRAQWRWPVNMPLGRALGGGLWEIRTDLPGNRTARVFVCLDQGVLVALHAFIRKTQTTPREALALARSRQRALRS